jgi:uncharacterized protein
MSANESSESNGTTPALRYRFEWDSNKERINIQKHDGITFRLASTVLHDPLAMTIYDEEHSETEDRWVSLGQAANGQTLVVVHTFTPIEGEANKMEVRLISARKADREERRDYEQGAR